MPPFHEGGAVLPWVPGADYTIELISIETYAPQFIGHNKIFLRSVKKSVAL